MDKTEERDKYIQYISKVVKEKMEDNESFFLENLELLKKSSLEEIKEIYDEFKNEFGDFDTKIEKWKR